MSESISPKNILCIITKVFTWSRSEQHFRLLRRWLGIQFVGIYSPENSRIEIDIYVVNNPEEDQDRRRAHDGPREFVHLCGGVINKAESRE